MIRSCYSTSEEAIDEILQEANVFDTTVMEWNDPLSMTQKGEGLMSPPSSPTVKVGKSVHKYRLVLSPVY